jgi:RNA polymerase sigma-70 factor (ECF subfamily)
MQKELVDFVVRAKAGDMEAFGVLYLKFYSKILQQLLFSGFQRAEAEDLCHDTFLQASQKLCQLENPASFSGWIMIIAKRLSINYALRNRHHHTLFADTANKDGVLDGAKVAEKNDEIRRVNRATQQLRKRYQEPLQAYYWQGLSQKEMAEKEGVPIGTIKRRLHVARKRLGKILIV